MSAKKPPDQKISNIAPFGLRMPSELRDLVQDASNASGRSMNAEIVYRLERSFLMKLEDLKDPSARLERLATMISDVAESLKYHQTQKLSDLEKELLSQGRSFSRGDDPGGRR